MATQDQINSLKALTLFSQKYANNDLFKYWIFKDHRIIHKWLHYFPIYDKWFKDFRNTDVVFVEVGVNHGGSMQMWKNYFGKDAKIIGVDINERCKKFEEDQISIEIGSQEDVNFWNEFKKKYPRVDVFLDDGGHTMNQQLVTLQEMFPHVRDGGVYVCEDFHTSYWKEEYGGLGKPDTFIEFTKMLIDAINAFHTRGAMPPNYFTMNMSGIHFYDSVVVIEKNPLPFPPTSVQIGTPAL